MAGEVTEIIDALATCLLVIVIFLIAHAFLVYYKKDLSLANFAWGIGCCLIAVLTFVKFQINAFHPMYLRPSIATALIGIWALRLMYYLRERYRKGADPRFVSWQLKEGTAAVIKKIVSWIFGYQLLLLCAMSLPIIIINSQSGPGLTLLDYFSIALWIAGFLCESVADYQLSRFMKLRTDANAILNTGLWYFSRHPNYFGESLMWIGLACMAIAAASPYGFIAFVAPITIISVFFLYSIPLLENTMINNTRYQEYRRTTPIFTPLFWWHK